MYSNVVSYSDGLPGEGHGIPYFYLTTLDPTARDALEDERTSFTLSEFPLGTCGKIDPENPTCAKLTLTGKVLTNYSNDKMIVHLQYDLQTYFFEQIAQDSALCWWRQNLECSIYFLALNFTTKVSLESILSDRIEFSLVAYMVILVLLGYISYTLVEACVFPLLNFYIAS